MTNKILIILGAVAIAAFFGYKYWDNQQENVFASRQEFEKAIEFIKKEKPTPPVGAIFYAKAAEKIANGEKVTEESLKIILEEVKNEEKNLPEVTLRKGNEVNEYWVGQNPFSPKISQYTRFLLKDFSYQVPPPPKYKSKEFYDGLNAVKEAASNRTTEQGALVNFYGGVPGTEQPAGIWQNILWENAKFDKNLTDQEYAKTQLILAQTLADAFMECWKVKYIYQTKRPDMTDKTIVPVLAMPNPPFPSYTSGHSTISFAAAKVLESLFPDKSEIWLKHAKQAKDSRLHAGIHFPYDNDEGQILGEEVAKKIIENL